MPRLFHEPFVSRRPFLRTHALARSIVATSLALLAACSGGSTVGAGDGGAAGGAGGTSGGGTGASSSVSLGGPNGPKLCATSSSTTTCTDANLQPYGQCIVDACDAQLRECFGSGYKSGAFAGSCGSATTTCLNACPCGDKACQSACGTPGAACTSCAQSLGQCASTCPLPSCVARSSSGSSGSSGASGAAGTCADLGACCASLQDPSIKRGCTTSLSGANGDESSCMAIYPSYADRCH